MFFLRELLALAIGIFVPLVALKRRNQMKRNDEERRLWVLNDEGLYLAWKASRLPIRKYIREVRSDIDEYIDKQLQPSKESQ